MCCNLATKSQQFSLDINNLHQQNRKVFLFFVFTYSGFKDHKLKMSSCQFQSVVKHSFCYTVYLGVHYQADIFWSTVNNVFLVVEASVIPPSHWGPTCPGSLLLELTFLLSALSSSSAPRPLLPFRSRLDWHCTSVRRPEWGEKKKKQKIHLKRKTHYFLATPVCMNLNVVISKSSSSDQCHW